MTQGTSALDELVKANHILAREGVVDAFGHISVRHPQNPKLFFLSRSRSPEIVTEDDIMTFRLDGAIECDDNRKPYLERFIHGAVYAARPDVVSVVHSHAPEVLPFSVARQSLRPVTHLGAIAGSEVPVWDIRDSFGDATDLLVSNIEQGRDLAAFLGPRDGVLMRGHGSVVVGASIREATIKAIYLSVNAKVLMQAGSIGEPVYLSEGEQKNARTTNLQDNPVSRAWEYFSRRTD